MKSFIMIGWVTLWPLILFLLLDNVACEAEPNNNGTEEITMDNNNQTISLNGTEEPPGNLNGTAESPGSVNGTMEESPPLIMNHTQTSHAKNKTSVAKKPGSSKTAKKNNATHLGRFFGGGGGGGIISHLVDEKKTHFKKLTEHLQPGEHDVEKEKKEDKKEYENPCQVDNEPHTLTRVYKYKYRTSSGEIAYYNHTVTFPLRPTYYIQWYESPSGQIKFIRVRKYNLPDVSKYSTGSGTRRRRFYRRRRPAAHVRVERSADSETRTRVQRSTDSKTRTRVEEPANSETRTRVQRSTDSKTRTRVEEPANSETRTRVQRSTDSKTRTRVEEPAHSETRTRVQRSTDSKTRTRVEEPAHSETRTRVQRSADTEPNEECDVVEVGQMSKSKFTAKYKKSLKSSQSMESWAEQHSSSFGDGGEHEEFMGYWTRIFGSLAESQHSKMNVMEDEEDSTKAEIRGIKKFEEPDMKSAKETKGLPEDVGEILEIVYIITGEEEDEDDNGGNSSGGGSSNGSPGSSSSTSTGSDASNPDVKGTTDSQPGKPSSNGGGNPQAGLEAYYEDDGPNGASNNGSGTQPGTPGQNITGLATGHKRRRRPGQGRRNRPQYDIEYEYYDDEPTSRRRRPSAADGTPNVAAGAATAGSTGPKAPTGGDFTSSTQPRRNRRPNRRPMYDEYEYEYDNGKPNSSGRQPGQKGTTSEPQNGDTPSSSNPGQNTPGGSITGNISIPTINDKNRRPSRKGAPIYDYEYEYYDDEPNQGRRRQQPGQGKPKGQPRDGDASVTGHSVPSTGGATGKDELVLERRPGQLRNGRPNRRRPNQPQTNNGPLYDYEYEYYDEPNPSGHSRPSGGNNRKPGGGITNPTGGNNPTGTSGGDTSSPGTSTSGNDQPTRGQTGDNQPTGGQPGNNQPTGGQPGNNQPTGGEPGNNQPTGGEPGNYQPTGGEPGSNQPTGGQPGNGQPTGNQPGDTSSSVTSTDSQPSNDQASSSSNTPKTPGSGTEPENGPGQNTPGTDNQPGTVEPNNQGGNGGPNQRPNRRRPGARQDGSMYDDEYEYEDEPNRSEPGSGKQPGTSRRPGRPQNRRRPNGDPIYEYDYEYYDEIDPNSSNNNGSQPRRGGGRRRPRPRQVRTRNGGNGGDYYDDDSEDDASFEPGPDGRCRSSAQHTRRRRPYRTQVRVQKGFKATLNLGNLAKGSLGSDGKYGFDSNNNNNNAGAGQDSEYSFRSNGFKIGSGYKGNGQVSDDNGAGGQRGTRYYARQNNGDGSANDNNGSGGIRYGGSWSYNGGGEGGRRSGGGARRRIRVGGRQEFNYATGGSNETDTITTTSATVEG